MNRILRADVILTLTREQAERLLTIVDAWGDCDLEAVVGAQCEKQGVEL